MKLDTAGKEYVGDQKEDSYIIRQITKWAYTHTDNELYWIFAHNKEEIMHYCQQDAKLTLKLGYLLNEENKSIFGFYLNTFASKAQIGKILTKNNCDTYKFVGKDGKTHSKMLYPEFKEDYNPAKYATAAYHGGIFDVMKRGTFGEVTDIDISSAYPSHQHTLPHWGNGDFSKLFDLNDLKDSDKYGWVLCEFDYPLIPYTSDELNKWVEIREGEENIVTAINPKKFYPTGKRIQIITLVEYRFLIKYGYYCNFYDGYVWRENKSKTQRDSPFSWIPEIYIKKQQIKDEFGKESYKYSLVKIPINGSYGITCQKVGQATYRNFYYASYITALTRIQICEMLEELDLYDKYISIATDGILIEGNIDIPDKYTKGGLGSWDVEHWDSALVLANGIYQLDRKGKRKLALRGLLSYDNEEGSMDLRELLKEHKDESGFYPTMKNRPITMFQAMRYSKYTKADINRFVPSGRMLNCDTDESKKWYGIKNFNDLLNGNFVGRRFKMVNGNLQNKRTVDPWESYETSKGTYLKYTGKYTGDLRDMEMNEMIEQHERELNDY